jgi:membrane metallo-endopeptidase-like protein 1
MSFNQLIDCQNNVFAILLPEAKNSMLEMTGYIREAFKEDILEKLDWMDEETKSRAALKLEKMDQSIAYSDEFLDKETVDSLHRDIVLTEDDYFNNSFKLNQFWRIFYLRRLREPVDSKSWIQHKLVAVANAFYMPSQNFMEFPAGILQGVFFNVNAPKYMNFGAIGSIIGHELTHGFDDQGKQRNENGRFIIHTIHVFIFLLNEILKAKC